MSILKEYKRTIWNGFHFLTEKIEVFKENCLYSVYFIHQQKEKKMFKNYTLALLVFICLTSFAQAISRSLIIDNKVTVTWTDLKTYTHFEITSPMTDSISPNDAWIALGFNNKHGMVKKKKLIEKLDTRMNLIFNFDSFFCFKGWSEHGRLPNETEQSNVCETLPCSWLSDISI